jgi:hypothetical protein
LFVYSEFYFYLGKCWGNLRHIKESSSKHNIQKPQLRKKWGAGAEEWWKINERTKDPGFAPSPSLGKLKRKPHLA